MVDFVRSTMTHTGAIVIRFRRTNGRVLGNPITDSGESLGPHGMVVDLARYFWSGGKPAHVPQRDAEYMNQTGLAISRAYRRETVLLPTHLLCVCAVATVSAWRCPTRCLSSTAAAADLHVPAQELLADMERLQNHLRNRKHHLGPRADGSAEQVVDAALTAFASYHTEPAAIRTPSQAVTVGDRQLLYYYQNRIESLGMSYDKAFLLRSSAAVAGLALASFLLHKPASFARTNCACAALPTPRELIAPDRKTAEQNRKPAYITPTCLPPQVKCPMFMLCTLHRAPSAPRLRRLFWSIWRLPM